LVRPAYAIRRYTTANPALAPLFPTVNDLGWVPDAAMRLAVRADLDAIPDAVEVILLENLPWDAVQLADLHRVAAARTARLLLLHLALPGHVITARAAARRVCCICTFGPAKNEADRCSSDLGRRADDEPESLTRRISAYHKRIAPILAL